MSNTKVYAPLRPRGTGPRWTGEQLFLLEKYWDSHSTTALVGMLKLTFGVQRTNKTVNQCYSAYFGNQRKKRKPNLPQQYLDLKAGQELNVEVQWKAKREPKTTIKSGRVWAESVPPTEILEATDENLDFKVDVGTTLVRVEGKIGSVSIKTKRSFQEILAFLVFLSKD